MASLKREYAVQEQNVVKQFVNIASAKIEASFLTHSSLTEAGTVNKNISYETALARASAKNAQSLASTTNVSKKQLQSICSQRATILPWSKRMELASAIHKLAENQSLFKFDEMV